MAAPLSGDDKPPTYMEATGAPLPAGAAAGALNQAEPSGTTYGPPGESYGQPPAGAYGQPPAGAYGQPPAGAYGQPPAGAYGQPPAGAYGQPPAGAYKPDQYQVPYGGGYQSGAAPGVYPGPPGYQPVVGQQPSYLGTTTITVQQQPSVVVVGGCPACRIGVLEDDFTFCGVCCAILFFPLGILCCLAMRQRHCPNCGAVFS